MNAFIKLGIGAVLLGVGFVVSMQAQRELIAKWQCVDCDDQVTVKEVTDMIDEKVEEVADVEPFDTP